MEKGFTSIIIPVHGCHEFTRICLDSIRAKTVAGTYEIIIVDNGSNPPAMPIWPGLDVKVIRNETNVGYPKSCNQGARQARGEILCFLNNDVIVTPGWLTNLTRYLGIYDVVGPMSNFILGRQQITLPMYNGEPALDHQAGAWREKMAGQVIPVNWVIGLCLVTTRELWDALGGYDETFGLGNSEDQDFCMKVRDAGKAVAIIQEVYIHHFGSVTHKALGLDYSALITENAMKLKGKWGDKYAERIRQDITE